MKAEMRMRLETTWGNQIELGVVSELDNSHDVTTVEITDLMVWTLGKMVESVRVKNERVVLNLPVEAGRDRERVEEMRTEEREREEAQREREEGQRRGLTPNPSS